MFGVITCAVVLLCMAISITAVSQDTLKCYSSELQTIIGGQRDQVTQSSYDCPSCTKPGYCVPRLDVCFILSSDNLYVFKGSDISQTLTLHKDCSPLRITQTHETDFAILCASKAPNYKPQFQAFYSSNGVFVIVDQLEGELIELSFAPFADNFEILVSEQSYYFVSIINNSSIISFRSYDGEIPKTIDGCENITKIMTGPIFDGKFQIIVDCVTMNGVLVRKRVLQSEDFTEEHVLDPLPAPLVDDTVNWSPQGTYISYASMSRVVLIQADNISNTPGILVYAVAEAKFLSDEMFVITIQGQNRWLVKLADYFNSMFDRGVTELLQTKGYCQEMSCNPSVFKDGILYLFTTDPDSNSYLLLTRTDLVSPATRIARVLISDSYDICFPINADIAPFEIVTPEPPTTIIIPSEAEEVLPITSDTIAGIVLGIGVPICGIVLLGVIICLCCKNRKKVKPGRFAEDVRPHENPEVRLQFSPSPQCSSAPSLSGQTPFPSVESVQSDHTGTTTTTSCTQETPRKHLEVPKQTIGGSTTQMELGRL